MKNGLFIFVGAFATLALSWAGVVLTAHNQLGGLTQYKDPVDDAQQVRREGFGSDVGEHSRKWGQRQSVARDYIGEGSVLIGTNRIGPDLRNVGTRYQDAEYFYKLLYAPETKFAGVPMAPGMPAHKFLFEVRPVGSV